MTTTGALHQVRRDTTDHYRQKQDQDEETSNEKGAIRRGGEHETEPDQNKWYIWCTKQIKSFEI